MNSNNLIFFLDIQNLVIKKIFIAMNQIIIDDIISTVILMNKSFYCISISITNRRFIQTNDILLSRSKFWTLFIFIMKIFFFFDSYFTNQTFATLSIFAILIFHVRDRNWKIWKRDVILISSRRRNERNTKMTIINYRMTFFVLPYRTPCHDQSRFWWEYLTYVHDRNYRMGGNDRNIHA